MGLWYSVQVDVCTWLRPANMIPRELELTGIDAAMPMFLLT